MCHKIRSPKKKKQDLNKQRGSQQHHMQCFHYPADCCFLFFSINLAQFFYTTDCVVFSDRINVFHCYGKCCSQHAHQLCSEYMNVRQTLRQYTFRIHSWIELIHNDENMCIIIKNANMETLVFLFSYIRDYM